MVETFEYSRGGDNRTGHGEWITPDFQVDLSAQDTSSMAQRRYPYDENAGKVLPDMLIFDDENIRFGLEKQDMPTMQKLVATAIQEGILNDDLESLQQVIKAFSSDRETMQAAVKEVDDVMVLFGREVRLGLTEEGGLVVFRTTGNTAMVIDKNGEANVRDLRMVNRDGHLAIGDQPNGDTDNFLDNMSMYAKLIPGQYYTPSLQFPGNLYRDYGYGNTSARGDYYNQGYSRSERDYGFNSGQETGRDTDQAERTWRNPFGTSAPEFRTSDSKMERTWRQSYGSSAPSAQQ
jgi:hypothetical protein